MLKILVADKLADEGLRKLQAASGVAHDIRPGLPPAELAAAVRDYDGMIIRSGVKVTAEVLANPGRLRAIARAGVGVDNVDLAAATHAGVLVMNTPDANTLSTAEHTMAMILALSRHVPAACADLKAGNWNRAKFEGAQLAGKTLGIVGLGRIGRALAQRALAFEMRVLAFDPFVQDATVLDGRVTVLQSLDAMLPQLDYITVHAVLSDATRNLIAAPQFEKTKKGLRIINCARGGIINEQDLAAAIAVGKVAGAAFDVFEKEPPAKDHPLIGLPQVVVTPHLGASTVEAQTAVSTEAVDALLDYLLNDRIRGACNAVGLPLSMTARERAYTDLAGRMGTILSSFCRGGVGQVTLTVYGQALTTLAPALQRFGLAALLAPFVSERLNVINVDEFARQRGIAVRIANESESRGPTDRVRLSVESSGERHDIEGTVYLDDQPRVLAIDGYPMNLAPAGDMLLIFNDDRPGVIGFVGTTLGNLNVNIADMALSRHANRALALLKLDAPPSPAAIAALEAGPAILQVRSVRLPAMG